MSELLSSLPSTSTLSESSTRTDYEYTITESRYGLYTSVLTDGSRMVTGPTEDACRWVTDNIHIPVMQGTYDGYTSVARTSVVDGKL
jgi:hypothetical protein